jgi:hypothetical protein
MEIQWIAMESKYDIICNLFYMNELWLVSELM